MTTGIAQDIFAARRTILDANYYAVLGLTRSASGKDVRDAYRALARKLHPDVNPGDQAAAERFKRVNEAHEVLSDEKSRKDYDDFGDNWKHADELRRAGVGRGGRAHGFGDFGWASGNADSVFNFFDAGFGQTRNMRPGPRVHETTAEISLLEAYQGTTRRLKLGLGAEPHLEFDVDIPAGVRDGVKIRIRPRAGLEVLIAVKIRPDSRFERRGDNLRVKVPVPFLDAVLGGEVEVPTLTGKVALTIPPGTQNGTALRIRGKGMPRSASADSFGDIVAIVDARLPEVLSVEEQELFSQLREVGSIAPDTRGGSDE